METFNYSSFSLTLPSGQAISQQSIQRLVRGQNVEMVFGDLRLQQADRILSLRGRSIVQILPNALRQRIADWLLGILAYRQRIQALTQATALPRDIQRLLLLELDYQDILRVCQDIEGLRNLCSDQLLWEQKAVQSGVSAELFREDQRGLPPSERYLEVVSYYGDRCARGSENYTTPQECLIRSARTGEKDLLRYFENILQYQGETSAEIQRAVTAAARRGDLEDVRLLVGISPSILRWLVIPAITAAAEGGYVDVAEYLISEYAQSGTQDMTLAYVGLFQGLASGNRLDLLEDYIKRIGSMVGPINFNVSSLQLGLTQSAATTGNVELFDRFFPFVRDLYIIEVAAAAGIGGNSDIVNRVLSVDNSTAVLNSIFQGALQRGRVDLARDMLDRGAQPNYEQSFIIALIHSQPESLRFLLTDDRVPKPDEDDLQEYLASAAHRDNTKIIDLLLEAGASDHLGAFIAAVQARQYKVARHLLRGPTDVKYDLDSALVRMLQTDDLLGARFIVQSGATPEDIRFAISQVPSSVGNSVHSYLSSLVAQR